MSALALTQQEPGPRTLADLKKRVQAGCPKRPGVYEFIDPTGGVAYVGKAKDLRTRLLSYFTAPWPESKSARMIRLVADIRWRPLPSEFAALIEEIRTIRRLRPAWNVQGARQYASQGFIRVTTGLAPRLVVTESLRETGPLYYGPFRGKGSTLDAVRVLSDLLGMRDCAERVPMRLADQPSLFDAPLQPLCIRHDLGTCLAPCAGRVSADAYAERVRAAVEFLEGRAAQPLDKVLEAMAAAAEAGAFERAAHWRNKFDQLTWLFAAVSRLRAAVEGLSFIYEVPDASGDGDDRLYLVRFGTIAAVAPVPRSPLERQAFAATVRRHVVEDTAPPAARAGAALHELMLVMSWFRQHPEEYERTTPYRRWLAEP